MRHPTTQSGPSCLNVGNGHHILRLSQLISCVQQIERGISEAIDNPMDQCALWESRLFRFMQPNQYQSRLQSIDQWCQLLLCKFTNTLNYHHSNTKSLLIKSQQQFLLFCLQYFPKPYKMCHCAPFRKVVSQLWELYVFGGYKINQAVNTIVLWAYGIEMPRNTAQNHIHRLAMRGNGQTTKNIKAAETIKDGLTVAKTNNKQLKATQKQKTIYDQLLKHAKNGQRKNIYSNINGSDALGLTPLMVSIIGNCHQTSLHLIRLGADMSLMPLTILKEPSKYDTVKVSPNHVRVIYKRPIYTRLQWSCIELLINSRRYVELAQILKGTQSRARKVLGKHGQQVGAMLRLIPDCRININWQLERKRVWGLLSGEKVGEDQIGVEKFGDCLKIDFGRKGRDGKCLYGIGMSSRRDRVGEQEQNNRSYEGGVNIKRHGKSNSLYTNIKQGNNIKNNCNHPTKQQNRPKKQQNRPKKQQNRPNKYQHQYSLLLKCLPKLSIVLHDHQNETTTDLLQSYQKACDGRILMGDGGMQYLYGLLEEVQGYCVNTVYGKGKMDINMKCELGAAKIRVENKGLISNVSKFTTQEQYIRIVIHQDKIDLSPIEKDQMSVVRNNSLVVLRAEKNQNGKTQRYLSPLPTTTTNNNHNNGQKKSKSIFGRLKTQNNTNTPYNTMDSFRNSNNSNNNINNSDCKQQSIPTSTIQLQAQLCNSQFINMGHIAAISQIIGCLGNRFQNKYNVVSRINKILDEIVLGRGNGKEQVVDGLARMIPKTIAMTNVVPNHVLKIEFGNSSKLTRKGLVSGEERDWKISQGYNYSKKDKINMVRTSAKAQLEAFNKPYTSNTSNREYQVVPDQQYYHKYSPMTTDPANTSLNTTLQFDNSSQLNSLRASMFLLTESKLESMGDILDDQCYDGGYMNAGLRDQGMLNYEFRNDPSDSSEDEQGQISQPQMIGSQGKPRQETDKQLEVRFVNIKSLQYNLSAYSNHKNINTNKQANQEIYLGQFQKSKNSHLNDNNNSRK